MYRLSKVGQRALGAPVPARDAAAALHVQARRRVRRGVGVRRRGARARRGGAGGRGRRAGARHGRHAHRLRRLALLQGQEGAVRHHGVTRRVPLVHLSDVCSSVR